MSEEFITLTSVKARGWSAKLIESVLGPPDKEAANPNYRSGPPMRLWLLSRVEAAEQTSPAFIAHKAKRDAAHAGASARSKAAVDRKRDELLAEADRVEVRVAALKLDDIYVSAISEWEARRADRGDYGANGRGADQGTRRRWAENYIRHNLCTYLIEGHALGYDDALDSLAGRIGKSDAVIELKRKVYEAIEAAYPELYSGALSSPAMSGGAETTTG
jgi:hypothetical protein